MEEAEKLRKFKQKPKEIQFNYQPYIICVIKEGHIGVENDVYTEALLNGKLITIPYLIVSRETSAFEFICPTSKLARLFYS